jgi:hypothetical protein
MTGTEQSENSYYLVDTNTLYEATGVPEKTGSDKGNFPLNDGMKVMLQMDSKTIVNCHWSMIIGHLTAAVALLLPKITNDN